MKRLLPLALVLSAGALHASPALANGLQQSIIQDDSMLKADPVGTLQTFRNLGVDRIRVNVTWDTIATNRKPANPTNPASYPAANWAPYDNIVRYAQADGIQVLFTLTSPAPSWVQGGGEPRGNFPKGVWEPSPSAFGQFVTAVGTRYSGSYKPKGASTPLPRVSAWSIWNEPNYGFQLAPQTSGSGAALAASWYRGLLAAAWGSLAGTSHTNRRDTILIGEIAPRGSNGNPGAFGGIKPLTFLRSLYCVDSRYRELRGSAARSVGCPSTAAASRRFRSSNAALFQANGFAAHVYTLQSHPVAPNVATNYYGGGRSDPNYADLPEVHRLGVTLNRLNGVYGSRKHFPIWNTEYGYRTRPPDRVGVSQATQAAWINFAEYLSWRQPGIATFDQYLLHDPSTGIFASGLLLPNGKHKLSFDAFRMPLWLPSTRGRRGGALEVWGDVRPAHFAGPGQQVQIQFQQGKGPFKTVKTVTITNPRGYFDVHLKFPGSGAVRTLWNGNTSRTQGISIH